MRPGWNFQPVRPAAAAVAVLVLLSAGCLTWPTEGRDSAVTADEPFVPRVVVGIVDSGILPYHDEFRQLRAGEDGWAHPSTYLTGFPSSAPALNLTLEIAGGNGARENQAEAYLNADSALWNATEQETLYWIPGTKIVGLMGIGSDLPRGGHGSMTSSRAAGNTISIPGPNVLLVHVLARPEFSPSGGDDPMALGTRWLADQPYIDIQSHSWGWPVACVGLAATHVLGWAEAFKYARDRQLVLVAAHNGHGNTQVTPGYPSQCQDNAGIAGVVTVGAVDNAGMTTWGNWFPAIAGDGCSNPAIDEQTIDGIANTGGGTSSATPFAAGGAAQLILEARRILRDPNVGIRDGIVATWNGGATLPATGPLADGAFTLDELKEVLLHTAQSPPTEDDDDGDECLAGTRVPLGQETAGLATFPFIGYGEVNRDSIALGVKVLQGTAELPARPSEDDLYRRDQESRRAMWG